MHTTGFIVESLYHFYYVFVAGQDVKCLNFFKFFDFFERVELFLHAFDGDVLPGLEGQCCKHH